MNPDQKALVDWILAGLRISEVRAGKGNSSYIFNNMIAKYSLYGDEYLLSQASLERMTARKVDLSERYTRGHFYGKESEFIYEHPIPANIILGKLLDASDLALTVIGIEQLLEASGPVCVLLREEDRRLTGMGLGNRMPGGWVWGQNPYARYDGAGIVLSDQSLLVKGAVHH